MNQKTKMLPHSKQHTIFMKPLLYLFLFIAISSCKTKILPQVKQYEASLEYETKSQLGEGAFWNHKTQELYWVDIEGMQLHIYSPQTKTNRSLEMPSRIGTVVPSAVNAKAVVALQDGIYNIDIHSGDLELVSEIERDIPSNRFNDGKCDPSGRLWVGSMALDQKQYEANLYMVTENGEATLKKDSVTISNGIVWTKDKSTMYYIDTPTLEIKAYDYDDATGAISNERVAVTVNESLGFPDGMTIDANDMLWVALWNGNAVVNYNPKSGKQLSKVEVPAHNVTSCAFGGPNLDVLYITSSSLDMTEAEKEQYPFAGSLFKVKLDVKGVKGDFFGSAGK
jgi:sugar lactone lactonase YvrE